MKAEFINPFVSAAFVVFERLGKSKVSKGNLSLISSPIVAKDINAVIGVTGSILGQVIYCLSTETALKVASAMMMGMPVPELDEIAKSAISELGNMITGNAATELGNAGYACNITPPTLFVGKDMVVSVKDIQILVIPLSTDFGEVTINVALREADQ